MTNEALASPGSRLDLEAEKEQLILRRAVREKTERVYLPTETDGPTHRLDAVLRELRPDG